MKSPGPPLESLRARLLRRVLVPLALVSLLGGAAVLTVAWRSTAQALDRSLLDDAYALAAHVKAVEGRLVLDLTERELGAALFDHREQLSFAVVGHDEAVLAGEARLQRVPTQAGAWAFADRVHNDEPVRTVTLRREGAQPFSVTVAQTTRERSQWLARLAGLALLPQLVLLSMLAWWLGRSITHELEPLDRLQRAVERRDTADLSPLEIDAPTREISGLGHELNALMRRVGEGVAAQREFAGNVAHQLRTPLAGIRALAAYGLKHESPAVWRAQLEDIAASEARASRLVEQLLALAYADEARDGLPLGPVALDDVVRETVLRFLPMADQQGAELGASGLEQPLAVWGHAALIEGAVANLVHNALRHGRPADGGAAVVSIDVSGDAAEVVVAVSDNGPGIAQEERTRLLQRWSHGGLNGLGGMSGTSGTSGLGGTSVPSGIGGLSAQGSPGAAPVQRQGAGLGLAIAARYATLMGGQLTLRAAPGGGLTAALSLRPRAPSAAQTG